MKILMVCLGNICRSPLAHGLLRDKVLHYNLDVIVESAGTSGHHTGEMPDARMAEEAMKNNCDLSQLRSRKFIQSDFDDYDLIYAMDKSNLENILLLARNENDRKKVILILNEISHNQNLDVPDPYYGGQSGFTHVYNLLDSATDQIIENLKK